MSYESHKYYNGNLYANIAKEVKKSTTIYGPTCGYCNGCRKINNYYEIYMWVLQWLQKINHYYETYMRVLHI
jgi:hypothetical protein